MRSRHCCFLGCQDVQNDVRLRSCARIIDDYSISFAKSSQSIIVCERRWRLIMFLLPCPAVDLCQVDVPYHGASSSIFSWATYSFPTSRNYNVYYRLNPSGIPDQTAPISDEMSTQKHSVHHEYTTWLFLLFKPTPAGFQ